jgi:hypothetical protein
MEIDARRKQVLFAVANPEEAIIPTSDDEDYTFLTYATSDDIRGYQSVLRREANAGNRESRIGLRVTDEWLVEFARHPECRTWAELKGAFEAEQ